MLRAATALVALACAGCSTLDLSASQNLLAAPADKVVESSGTVPLSVERAYRNTLAKARQCWGKAFGFPFTATPVIEHDPYDPSVGEARIALRVTRNVHAVVQLKPLGPESTSVLTRGVKNDGVGTIYGIDDVPMVPRWAAGEDVKCITFVLM